MLGWDGGCVMGRVLFFSALFSSFAMGRAWTPSTTDLSQGKCPRVKVRGSSVCDELLRTCKGSSLEKRSENSHSLMIVRSTHLSIERVAAAPWPLVSRTAARTTILAMEFDYTFTPYHGNSVCQSHRDKVLPCRVVLEQPDHG